MKQELDKQQIAVLEDLNVFIKKDGKPIVPKTIGQLIEWCAEKRKSTWIGTFTTLVINACETYQISELIDELYELAITIQGEA